jgi:hypothetical protein
MPEYLSPGVYVEEVDAGTKPIEGVSTSTAGFVGVTERGRFGYPELVTSFAQYVRLYGHHLRASEFPGAWYLSHAMQGFFTNGGKRAYVVRVLPGTAAAAEVTLYDQGEVAGPIAAALAARTREGDGYLVLDDAAAVPDDGWLLLGTGADSEYVQAGGADAAVVVVRAPLPATVGDGDGVGFYALADSGTATDLDGDADEGVTQLTLDDATGIGDGDLLRLDDGARTEYVRVLGAPAGNVVTLDAATAFAHLDATPVTLVDPPVLQGALTLAAGEAPAGTHLVAVADASDAATADAVGFGPAPTVFHALGGALVTRLATALARNAAAGDEVTSATLAATTAFNLTADAAAGDEELDVDDLTDIVPGAVLLLDDGNPEAEYVVVDAVDGAAGDPGTVTLRSPLRFAHLAAAATVVDDDTPGPGDAGFPPDTAIVARLALAGDDVVVLSVAGGIAAGDVLRFGDAVAGTVEYRQVAADDLDLLALAAPVASAHLAGTAAAGRVGILGVQAIDAGAWGNSLRILAEDDDPLLDTTVTGAGNAGDPTIDLASGVGIEPGTVLEFYNRIAGADVVLFRQKVQGRIGNIVSFAAGGLAGNAPAGTRVRTREFRLTVAYLRTNPRTQRDEVDPEMSETFRHLTLDPRHSRYAVTVIGPIPALPTDDREGESRLVKVSDLGAATAEADLRLGPDPLEHVVGGQTRPLGRRLSGGDDAIGTLVTGDYIGADSLDPEARTGLHALKNIEEVSIVAMPGRTSQVEQNALVEHCEAMRYRVSVLDSRPGDGVAEVQEHRNLYDSRYAAIYYPWLQIPDPFPRNPRAPLPVGLPPSGHVVGIYARSDNTRGVHKAPANEVLRGITGVEVKLTKGEHDILNPRNINVIRDFREQARGIRIWGARIVTSDSDWRYLNVRRLFNFVEHSLDRGTQWVVFEPNDHRLWARLGQSVSGFLNLVWKDGALMGRTPEEAFFVRVDETTMTQDDIDAGRLIMLIGIAPVKPAEFVIIRIGQWAGGSSIQEL